MSGYLVAVDNIVLWLLQRQEVFKTKWIVRASFGPGWFDSFDSVLLRMLSTEFYAQQQEIVHRHFGVLKGIPLQPLG